MSDTREPTEDDLVERGMQLFDRIIERQWADAYPRFVRTRELLQPLLEHLQAYPPEQSMAGVNTYLISFELPVEAVARLRDLLEGKPLADIPDPHGG